MCGVHSSFFVCWEGRTAWQYCGKSRQCNSLEQNFRSSIGRVNGICDDSCLFEVRQCTTDVRRQRTKRRLSSLARQTASQSPDQTAQSETRCLPAFKTRRQTPQTVVCAVRFYSSVCQARHKSRRKCPIAREHPWCTVEPQKDRNHRRCR